MSFYPLIRYVCAVLSIVLAAHSWAQGNVFAGNVAGKENITAQDDPQAAAQRLAELLRPMQTFRASFTQVTLDQRGNELQQLRGEIAVQRPGRFYWHVEPPMEQVAVSDGEHLWLYDPDLEQVTIQQVDMRLTQTPALILSGNVEDLNSAFSISYQRQGQQEAPQHRFELVPTQPDSLFERLELSFFGQALVQMELHDALGQHSRLEFDTSQANPSIDPQLFQFEPPEGVDIITQ